MPHFPPVVDTPSCDVGVPQPFLDFGDICIMFQRTDGGCGVQSVRAEAGDIDFQGRSIAGYHLVDAVGRDRGHGSSCQLFFKGRNSAPRASAQ